MELQVSREPFGGWADWAVMPFSLNMLSNQRDFPLTGEFNIPPLWRLSYFCKGHGGHGLYGDLAVLFLFPGGIFFHALLLNDHLGYLLATLQG